MVPGVGQVAAKRGGDMEDEERDGGEELRHVKR